MNSKEITKSGFLEVSTIHKLYYEVCGNPKAETILFLHGGPGAGFADKDKRFFNFEKQQVVFFDQRGASRSLPFGSIIENTTQDLVEDINKLLCFLNIEKVTIFGGSWGTALALIYAIQFPDKVKELLLRGVYIVIKNQQNIFLKVV
ncbi:proline iminopeptidase [Flavobacterium sp. 28A]|uniref:alpha/beta fold hydrolase n=1 Tax=Flavobacterium sp. 28A TaxID=2735895 RepID=UPI0015712F0E|nr:alpha/beta fold hydrolase [Flavobacterium sp. 28A]NRT14738.1 proline iminopeptidase [Flavobacterium sp. 28A]